MDDLEKSVSDNENDDENEDAVQGDDNEVIKNKSSKNQTTGVSDVESDIDDTDRESDANSVLDGDDNSDAETNSDYEGDELSEKDTTVKNIKNSENSDDIIKEYLQPSLEDSYKNKNRSDDESSDYETGDETDDEDRFKKLDHSRDLLTDIHKNLQSINYIEVEQLSKITRDELGRIIDDNHRTVPILSKYERTRILGLRTKQINNGSKPFINVAEDIIDGYIIAERELLEKKIPFIIKRPISNDKFEYWRLEDLEIV